MKKFYACCMALLPIWVAANNIQVTDISLAGINTTNKTVQVRFSVSWENSWRVSVGPANWDAAWIFIKYRLGGVGDWKHAWLNNAGHVAATGSNIVTGLQTPGTAFNAATNPGIGAFVHRSANGTGRFTCSNMQLQWNYGANGVTNTDLVEVKVFAIEMVYVPQGEFAAGETGGSSATTFDLTTINTANALTDPSGTGSLGGKAGGYPNGKIISNKYKPSVSNYPNGFNAFYCMKYEITQKGYVDFLNMLSFEQQKMRVASTLDSSTVITNRYVMSESATIQARNGIRAPSNISNKPILFYCDLNSNDIPDETDDGLDIACNYLTFEDVWAYLWWAGLRPMTDMEFEKGCRGNLPSVPAEYAWGSAVRQTSAINTSSLDNAGTSSEQIKAGFSINQINVTSVTNGPGRVGILAKANTTRFAAGAAYYGMMEMTGNLTNFAIGVTDDDNTEARNYIGDHGNGNLSTIGGIPDNATWSTNITDVVLKPLGSIGETTSRASLSNISNSSDLRRLSYGGRGVRTQ